MTSSTTETIEALEKQTAKVKLTIEVPVGIAEFFNDLGDIPLAIQCQSLQEFATEAVLTQFESLLNSLPWAMFNLPEIHRVYGLRKLPRQALESASP